MNRTRGLVVALTILVAPGYAWADNTSSVDAYSMMPGAPAAEATVSNTAPTTVNRWYVAGWLAPHRSYCVQTYGGADFDTSTTTGNTNTVLTLFGADATTVKDNGVNDDILTEPRGWALSRVCFATGDIDEKVYIRVSAGVSGSSFKVRTQLIETTLFSNWFFTGSDYLAYTLIRNTTNEPLQYGIRWRNAAGTEVAHDSGVLPANGSIAINARAYPGAVTAIAGTVDIIHIGPPDAIVASTTVLSTTTGLSFDAPFNTRRTY
jgi:hypothetical protein